MYNFNVKFFPRLLQKNFPHILPTKVKVAHSIGKVEFVLEKMRPGKWPNLGEALEDSGRVVKESGLHPEWREWYVCGREQVTHDVQRLFLKPPVDNQVGENGNTACKWSQTHSTG